MKTGVMEDGDETRGIGMAERAATVRDQARARTHRVDAERATNQGVTVDSRGGDERERVDGRLLAGHGDETGLERRDVHLAIHHPVRGANHVERGTDPGRRPRPNC